MFRSSFWRNIRLPHLHHVSSFTEDTIQSLANQSLISVAIKRILSHLQSKIGHWEVENYTVWKMLTYNASLCAGRQMAISNATVYLVISTEIHTILLNQDACREFHVTWWRHQMETFSALLALYMGNSPVTGEFPSQRASDAELWCFIWSGPCINGWVNNRGAGDLRRHRGVYDVIVM